MGASDDRASIMKGDALKVLPDLDLDEDDDVDDSKVPLTRSNVYADSPREIHLSEGISEADIILRQRVGIAFVLGLVLASAICVMLLGVLGHEENYGTGDNEMAKFIRSSAIDFGFEESNIKIDEFEMLVNAPETLTLDILKLPNNKSLASYDFVAENAARQAKRQAKGKNVTKPYAAFHLYSKNGTASGPVVYAHFGSSEDYQALALNNVTVAGKIALVRMGGDISLPAKVVIASKFGAVGVLTYTCVQFARLGPTAPDGPWRPSTTTTFGNVYMGDGDPTMPEGFSATRPMGTNADRLSVEDIYSVNNTFNILPPIVSMPISAAVAEDLLTQVDAASKKLETLKQINAADVFGARWEGGALGVQYLLPVDDDTSKSEEVEVIVKMTNRNVYTLTTTWNVVITVHGSREPDRHVLVGAPRDSLNAGAVSPGSGNAVFLRLFELWELSCPMAGPRTARWSLHRSVVSNSAPLRNLGGRISPFLGRLGIPSLELGFDGGYFGVGDTGADIPAWISHFADPQFAFHRAAAELYGSILLSFTDAQFLQYDFTELSRELRRGEAFLEDALAREGLTEVVSLGRLHNATTAFEAAAISVSHEINVISDQELDFSRVRLINNRLLRAQRAFLLPLGFTYMPWIKNVSLCVCVKRGSSGKSNI
ncbi:Transferrin receptor-like, dimerization domain [Phytophthora cactorum]|nr:Transferrin receptor-like, dimerization domain [Phytophthora cactorum]